MFSNVLRFLVIFTFNLLMVGFAFAADKLVIFGKIPGQYIKGQKSTSVTVTGYVAMEDKLITAVEKISPRSVNAKKAEFEAEGYKVVKLYDSKTRKYDVIYPGLIDLHGHNKQNVLPTWGQARGQFGNRFEWRKRVKNYKEVASGNMNPWSSGKMAQVAAYRWSELQAMVLGTTYLQGYILNDKGFGIHSVEDSKAVKSKRKAISSSGDIIDPTNASFLWTDLKPVIEELGCLGKDNKCYGKAVVKFLNDNCSDLPEVVTADVYHKDSYNWLLDKKNRATLDANCDVENKESFLNYFSDVFGVDQHKSFISKFNQLQGERRSALITHIAEGRKNDPYNATEFKLLELGGLAIPGVSLIHAVGLDKNDFKTMAKNDMGLVWSPYSNFLLYGETVDIIDAKKAGVLLALGSDWTPTGSKAVLEELKLAYNYLKKRGLHTKITTRDLYDMVTANPAKMMNHYGFEGKGEHGIGTIEVGAMATLIVARSQVNNPFTNLVAKTHAQDINMVIVDGKPVYGNKGYLKGFGEGETISDVTFTTPLEQLPTTKLSEVELGKFAAGLKLGKVAKSKCGFKTEKVFIQHGESKDYTTKVKPYLDQTGLNLDRFEGIQKYLGVALLSQSKNALGSASLKKHAVKKFPPLYGCADDVYKNRLSGMAKAAGTDEIDHNHDDRAQLRVDMGLYSEGESLTLPHELAELYELEFEIYTNLVELKGDKVRVDTEVEIVR